MKIRTILLLLPLATALLSCAGTESGTDSKVTPPACVSVSPADGATGIAVSSASVVFTYDQNVKVTSANKSLVTVSGDATVSGVNAYGKDVTVSIEGLKYSTTYTVSIPSGVVQGYKDGQDGADAVSVSFTTAAEPEDPGTDEHLSEDAWELASQLGLGWNMGNHFDAFYNGTWAGDLFLYPNETCWGASPATQTTFDGVAAAGFTSVRIPVTWLKMIGDAPSYTLNETWLNRVYEVVGFAHNAGLNVIINTHHDENHHSIIENGVDIDTRWQDVLGASKDDAVNTQIKEEITAVWTQIANKFADCGDWLIFEGFNEINDGGWGYSSAFRADPTLQCGVLNEWNQTFVDAVRATGGNNATRWLGAPTYAANPSFVSYYEVPDDPAGKVMVSVHYYDPSPYTIGAEQYSDWGHTGASGLKAGYGDEDFVQSTFNTLMRNYVNKGIPVYLGEFGCSMRSKSNTRAWAFFKYYMEYVVKAAHTYGLPAFLWDNGAEGDGQEHHGYINHGTGGYIGNSKEIIDLMVKATADTSESYTLQSVYDSAPIF